MEVLRRMVTKGVAIRYFEFTVIIEKDETGVQSVTWFVQESEDPDKFIRIRFDTYISEFKEFLEEILEELKR